MILKVMKIENEAILPQYQTSGASGFDLHAIEDVIIKTNERILVRTGLAFEIESGFEVQIRSRSSLALKHGVVVLNSPGTIDSDYRGEIKIILMNFGKDFQIKKNDRIAQGILAKVEKAQIEPAIALAESLRGSGGFGSTGI